MTKTKVVIFGSFYESLLSFRGDLIKKLEESNFEVYTISPKPESEKLNLRKNHYFLDFKRNKINFISDLINFFFLIKIIRKIRSKLIIPYTVKPILFTGLISVIFKINVCVMITGIGNTFTSENILQRFIKILIILLYRIFFLRFAKVIFQNKEHLELFYKLKIISNKHKCIVVNGSGVNLNKYKFNAMLFKPRVTFLMISRLLKNKGIKEYLIASNNLSKKYSNIDFLLIGALDFSIYRFSKNDFNLYNSNNAVNYLGYKKNTYEYLKKASVIVLPSYSEGMPRSILEALSVGRPIITTDIPGSRETVIENRNGFLIKTKDDKNLFTKMEWFVNNPSKIPLMGKESNKLAKQFFDSEIINKKIINFINEK